MQLFPYKFYCATRELFNQDLLNLRLRTVAMNDEKLSMFTSSWGLTLRKDL